MKAVVLLSLCMLLLMPLVAADFTLDSLTEGDIFSSSDIITFSGQCTDAGEFAVQIVAGASTVDVLQTSVAGGPYTVSTSLSDGEYTAYAWCGSTITRSFCVGPECRSTTPVDTTVADDDDDDDSSSGRGRSGGGCRPDWSCSAWSHCDNNLEQRRECVSLNNCFRNQPVEVMSCSSCDESWTCSLWSECSAGKNVRTCLDEHHCGTTLTKPALTKSCTVTVPSGTQPKSVNTNLPPPQVTSPYPTTTQPSIFQTLWQNYSIFLIAIPFVIILIVLMTMYLLHHIHKHKPAINEDQLHTYVREELASGMSQEQVRSNLQKAGWNDQEISEALSVSSSEQIPELAQEKPLY